MELRVDKFHGQNLVLRSLQNEYDESLAAVRILYGRISIRSTTVCEA
jgi:hypothetical protein